MGNGYKLSLFVIFTNVYLEGDDNILLSTKEVIIEKAFLQFYEGFLLNTQEQRF